MTFTEQWLAAVDAKNSVLCAGLDPAEYEMGRGKKGLPEDADKLDWALSYVEAVARYCAAVKPNVQYWKGRGDMESLHEITSLARELGLVIIDDSKLADIGATNDAGFFYGAQRADAVTVAPFAGNMEEMARQARERGVGAISMCLMSNPEYEAEKSKLVRVDPDEYDKSDIIRVRLGWWRRVPHVRQYAQLAHDARAYKFDGAVIGAPSPKNHITYDELMIAHKYLGNDVSILLPGVGAQGGEAHTVWHVFDNDRVIVNVGRAMMFPEGRTHAETAKYYQEMLNRLRA